MEVASRAALLGGLGMKVAYVDLKAEHHEMNLFGETVAVNRGVCLKCFRGVVEGEKWLLADKENGRCAASSFRGAPEAIS